MEDRWGRGPTPGGDELDGLVYLSRRIGADPDLVQPGGGNSSIKCRIEEPFGGPVDGLMVKGSGSDLRTVERENFTRLALSRLAPLRDRSEMADEEMVELMGAAMIHPHRDRFPSLETPLHALLPYRVIVHTHDVATMSLTNLPGDAGRDLVKKLFPGELHFVPFFRPGFPLARAIREISTRIPAAAVGMVLAHHGLVVWGEDPEECYRHLLQVVEKAEQFLQERKKGTRGRAG
ncbi:MAG: class II aldolase/adducin family protein, partial [Acidobacteria bacterium]|nr:class II aldolase/adducin family protein [Acidobacteriota bacterium]